MSDTARSVGFGALAIAFIAVGAGRDLVPRTASAPTRAEVVVNDGAVSAPSTGGGALLEDSIVTGTALLEEFFADSLAHLARCTDAAQCYDLDFLIVSLPDPLDSFLDWAFDACSS